VVIRRSVYWFLRLGRTVGGQRWQSRIIVRRGEGGRGGGGYGAGLVVREARGTERERREAEGNKANEWGSGGRRREERGRGLVSGRSECTER
jgi:hypothetical protein